MEYVEVVLIGRHAECALIDELLDGARRSQGGAVVVRGEAGVGKTALLDYAADRPDVRVLRGTGVQAESEFAYASAHQLLRPLLPFIDVLPTPQADAVRIALGMSSGGPPDRFLVALGFLSLLSEAGRDQSLLCVLDDLQWCDSASTDALLFAARRLATDPVAFVFAVRDEPGKELFDVPAADEVVVSGLSEAAATELLGAAAGVAVPESVRSVLVARTRGNPLALLEVARALSGGQLAGHEPLPDPLPGGDRLERGFLDRAQRLSIDAQQLLLVAAAEESGDIDIVAAATGGPGAIENPLAEAESSGLLTIRQGRLEFCHPLVRSAVYTEAAPRSRRAAHGALAAVLAERGHVDRGTWHLAAAATGPDETLAGELELVAERAGRRSAHGAASAGYERAADLSPETSDRTRRLVAAAESAWLAGQAPRARNLVDRAELTTADPVLRAQLLHLKGRAASRNGEVARAYRILCDAAKLVQVLAPRDALEMLADAVEAAMYAGDSDRAAQAAHLAADLDPGPGARQRFLSAWLAAESTQMQGRTTESAEWVRVSLTLAEELEDPRLLTWAGIAAVNLGDISGVQTWFRKAVESARNSGAVASLPYPLEKWSVSEALAGNYAAARSSAEEGLRLAHETEQLGSACHLQATLAFVAGTCGDEEECRRHGQQALDEAIPRGLGIPIANATWAFGRLDLGLGRYEKAVDQLLSMQDAKPGTGNPVMALWATTDLVEAAAHAGRLADVTDAVGRLHDWAAASGKPTAVAHAARCRGLMGDPDAVALLTEAAGAFHAAHSPYEEARTQLALGEMLRRRKQRSAAREHLRSAFGAFQRLGARAWADRAAAELRATGEAVQRDRADGLDQLTPQELQIIRQVCQGASNRDVAAQLFISPRTVEYHLYKAYPKLGISSRTQLIHQFGSDAQLAGAR